MIEIFNKTNLTNKTRKPGSVLVLVLIVLSSLIILSVGLAYRTKIEVELAFTYSKRIQSYYLALGGIERIKVLLSSQEPSPLFITQVCQFNGNAMEENLFEINNESSFVEDMLLTYSLRDELSYFCLNHPNPAAWENIGYIEHDYSASILDWIDADENANQGGAETNYYERFEPPYISKNAPFTALKELLYIKGATQELYAGEDLNHNMFLDNNERDGFVSAPYDNGDNLLDYGLVDTFTVYGNGRININTVNPMILKSLPGLDERVAQLICSYRTGYDGVIGTSDDKCFENQESILSIESMSEIQASLLMDYCCFDSQYFRIFSSSGFNNSFKCSLMAIVGFQEEELKVFYMERLL